MILQFTQKLTTLIDDDQNCELWKGGEQLITSFSSTKYKAGWSAPGFHWTRHPHYNIGLSWSRFVYLSCQHKHNIDRALCCKNLCRSSLKLSTSVKYRSSWETDCTGEGVFVKYQNQNVCLYLNSGRVHIKGHTVELVPGRESGSSTKSNSSIILVVEVVEVPVEIVPGGGEGGWREANRDFIS